MNDEDLKARVEELLSIPRIAEMIKDHRASLLAAETAAANAAAEAAKQAQADEVLRQRVARDPLVTLTVAPGVRVVRTARGFCLAYVGDRFRGGVVVAANGEPAPTSVTLLTSEWKRRLREDEELRAHADAGHLCVEPVPIERIVKDARGQRLISRLYL